MDGERRATRHVKVDAARLGRWIEGFGERHGQTEIVTTQDEVTLTGADGARAWIEVPFGPLVGDLVEHVERERRIGVLLVRRGGHAAGVFQGRRLISSKVGSSYVQGTTKAGGWSQQRYARRRANQTSAAFADAADAAAKVFTEADLDALVLGGDREGVRGVLADTRLGWLHEVPLGPWIEVKDPRLRILEASPEQFLCVRIGLDP